MATYTGSAISDLIDGTESGDSFLLQQGGDDRVNGLGGSDGFYFGSVFDFSDAVYGGAGIDTLALQGAYASLVFGEVREIEVLLLLSGANATLGDTANNRYSYTMTTNDSVVAAGATLTVQSHELLQGENFIFNGQDERDGQFRIFAGQGDDVLLGGTGGDGFLFGAQGNFTGADRVNGGAGTDSLALRGHYTGAGAAVFQDATIVGVEVIALLSGHTKEFGGFIDTAGFDYEVTTADGNILAGSRLDVIAANLRDNESVRFDGRAESDGSFRIISGAGDDQIQAGAGADLLFGGAGADILDGGQGADTLDGGTGADTFAFTSALGGGNVDSINGFVAGTDKVLLGGEAGQPFAPLPTGALKAGSFVLGAAALEADDFILYNQATGALFYDADGNGAGGAVQFATVSPGLALTAADFIVSGPANQLPVISSAATASIAENSSASTIVYQATANDADGDTITWSLQGADAALFTIDQAGAVRLISPADFEVRKTYSISVAASDGAGEPVLKAVTVNVTDVSDTAASTPIIAEAEPNDSSSQTQPLARDLFAVAPNPNLNDDDLPSVTVQGNITSPSDKDWYRIELKAGELLILDIDKSSGNLDSQVKIFSPNVTNAVSENDDLGVLDAGSDPHPDYGHNTDSYLRFRAPADGIYYIMVESFPSTENPTFGTYELNVSVGPPATAAELLDEDIDALLAGTAWESNAITYAFPNEADDYPGQYSDDEPATFLALTATQQTAATAALQSFANISGLTFTQLPNDDEGSALLRFAMTDATEAAHAYLPGDASASGSIWFNKEDFSTPRPGNYAWSAMLHEIGHALGMKHGHESPAVTSLRDRLDYSVMSYRSYQGASVDEGGGYSNEFGGYPQTLMMLDIAAIQRLYGANWSYNGGDSVYKWTPASGQTTINGVGQGLPVGNRIFLTVWDGGGVDTYDFSAYGQTNSLEIDLRPGEWTTLAATQVANLGFGNMAEGNIANALLFEGDPRSLIENAIGGTGDDRFTANAARNELTGGAGSDTFNWASREDLGLGMTADVIKDFQSGSDRIDLRGVDAISATSGDDAFTFIGSGAFTGTAGQLRAEVSGASLNIFGDVNGDAVADFQIILLNQTVVTGADFFP